jgi:8-oxo-dGTP diphosphatase
VKFDVLAGVLADPGKILKRRFYPDEYRPGARIAEPLHLWQARALQEALGQPPQVGVCVIVRKVNWVLLGKRKGGVGEGWWGPPGGRVEEGEEPIDAARRELVEETNLVPYNGVMHDLQVWGYTKEDDGEAWVTLFFECSVLPNDEPRVTEPDKCEGWYFYPPEDLPGPLFTPARRFLLRKD